MPINNITQTISTLPEAGRRGVDVQTVFVNKQEDFQDHLQGTTVTELNTLKDQLNSRIGEINSTVTTMNGYADTASAGASTATTKAGEASTSASGALTSRNQASTFATTATTKAGEASTSATKASQWADTAYNVEVEAGKYSAKHWSVVAQNTATAGKVDKVVSTDNAIVRFDGTAGDVQNSSITIDDSGNIGSGTQTFNGFGGSGFKNYIINGNFDVWQRGTNINIAGGTIYCADRFLAYNTATTPTATIDAGTTGYYNSLKVSGATSVSNKHVIQRIEAINSITLGRDGNTKVTFSFWAKTDVATNAQVIIVIPNVVDIWDNVNYTTPKYSSNLALTKVWTKYSVTFDLDFVYWGGIQVDLSINTACTSLWTTGWQLERGSVATPYENRPIGLELSLCKRYLPSVEITQGYEYSGGFLSATYGFVYIPFEIEARVMPTGISLSTSNIRFVNATNGAPIGTGIVMAVSSKNGCQVLSTGVTTAIAGQVTCLYDPIGTTKILFTGCEL